MDAIAILKAQISANASRRIREASEDLTRPKILHTQYLGDRTVQQLGQEPDENAVILNNAANTIGDALMPLAKGSPLQRFDSFNQDDGVGTAKRSLLDNDANRNGSNFVTLRTGEQEPANDPLKGTPRGRDPLPKDYPPPFGCVPLYPAKQCIWIPSGTSPSGYQSHGSAVINQDGLELFLHCQDGVVPPTDLGCTFLGKWKCSGGVCSPDATGTYNSQAECEAALIPPDFNGGQCSVPYNINYTAFGNTVPPYGEPTSLVSGSVTLTGKIRGTACIVTASGSSGQNWQYVWYIYTDPIPAGFPIYTYSVAGFLVSDPRGYLRIDSIVRSDGLPDNCGNLPSTCP